MAEYSEHAEAVACELHDVLDIYRDRLNAAGAPAALLRAVDELDDAMTPLGEGSVGPHPHADADSAPGSPAAVAAPSGSQVAVDEHYCGRLLGALNAVRTQYAQSAIDRAAPGFGEETVGELNAGGTPGRAGLLEEIGRLERAVSEAGCPI